MLRESRGKTPDGLLRHPSFKGVLFRSWIMPWCAVVWWEKAKKPPTNCALRGPATGRGSTTVYAEIIFRGDEVILSTQSDSEFSASSTITPPRQSSGAFVLNSGANWFNAVHCSFCGLGLRCLAFLAITDLPLAAYRLWPIPIPSWKACCLTAPTVRFIAFATLATAVLLLECCFSSRRSTLLQARRTAAFTFLTVLFVFFAMPQLLLIRNLKCRLARLPGGPPTSSTISSHPTAFPHSQRHRSVTRDYLGAI
jgi:hypothetical protein